MGSEEEYGHVQLLMDDVSERFEETYATMEDIDEVEQLALEHFAAAYLVLCQLEVPNDALYTLMARIEFFATGPGDEEIVLMPGIDE